MRNAISIFILFLCCLLAATFLVVSVWMLPHELLHDSEGWGMMLVGFIDVPLLAGTGLLARFPVPWPFGWWTAEDRPHKLVHFGGNLRPYRDDVVGGGTGSRGYHLPAV